MIFRAGRIDRFCLLECDKRLAAAIERLLNSPELRQRLGQAGRQLAIREFSEEIVLTSTLALYQSLLGSKWPASNNRPLARLDYENP